MIRLNKKPSIKKRNRHIIIDADSLIYKAAVLNEETYSFDDDGNNSVLHTDLESAKACLKEDLENIIKDTKARSYKAYITGKDNFRYTILPTYKSNRKDIKKPELLEALREYAINELGFVIVDGMEADDACCIDMTKEKRSILCHIDKDLNQIEGLHYNWNKQEFYEIDPQSGLKFFFMQVLTGDPSDGYKGCPSVGKVKAKEAVELYLYPYPSFGKSKVTWFNTTLERSEDLKKDLWEVVVKHYQKALAVKKDIETLKEYEELREEAEKEALTQARVAYMLRDGDVENNGNIIGFKPPIYGGCPIWEEGKR